MKLFSFYQTFSPWSAVLAAGLLGAAVGQTVNLSGTVKDSSTQKAISDAAVGLKVLAL
jgi:hypothetical protein